MVSIIDRLIEDETRKKQGEFFTPSIWVEEAHKMISEQFGSDWKEKYVVWDCAWGTGNLTRDYNFKELYCSTLHESDIKTAEQMIINPEAIKFQFDFLNDDLELLKEPDYAPKLYQALQEGKEIIFLINPPYSTATNLNNIVSGTSNKKGVAATVINDQMKCDDWGASSQQLYAQFLYRISKIQTINKKTKIALFSPPLFLSGSSYKKFREQFFKHFSFKTGYLINANNFADVKSWGLSFVLLDEAQDLIVNDFHLIKKELNNNLNVINSEKIIYNLDNDVNVTSWAKTKPIKPTIRFTSKSALNIGNKEKPIDENGYGFLVSNGNNIQKNISDCFIIPHCSNNNQGGTIINKNNYKKCVSLFAARKTIKSNWVNQKDEYLAPTDNVLRSLEYKQWNNDAIVYSLFNTSSNQSSMRQVEYKDKLWNIKNEFFWLSNQEMMELAEEYYFDELYKDARYSDDRYVYKLLQETVLSPDAQELLDMSKELIRKSFKMRKFMSEDRPEYHLNAWDAGWYQMKKVLNIYYKEDYKIFVKKYKAFEDRMRPYVYKFGFLKQ